MCDAGRPVECFGAALHETAPHAGRSDTLQPPLHRTSHCDSGVEGAAGGGWRNARSACRLDTARALTLPLPPCSQSRWRPRSLPHPTTSTGAALRPAWAPYRLVPLPPRLPAPQFSRPPPLHTRVACGYAQLLRRPPSCPAAGSGGGAGGGSLVAKVPAPCCRCWANLAACSPLNLAAGLQRRGGVPV